LVPRSVVICHLDIISIAATPCEADSIPIVDSDTVLSSAIALQGLQSISRKSGEVGELARGIHHAELLECRPGATLKPPASAGRE
jgi:hypothetical protein